MLDTVTAAIGWSTRSQAEEAGREAAGRALVQLAPSTPKLALLFSSSWFEQTRLVTGVRAALGDLPLAGASTAGEIVANGPISHSCVVVLLAGTELACSVGLGEEADRTPREAGRQAAASALQGFPDRPRAGFLLFGDGLITGYADVVRGIQEVLGTSSLIIGGAAGDDLRFTQTTQYCNDRAVSRSIVGVLLGGPILVGVGSEHGFAPLSKPRRITRAQANILYELDRQPAALVYEEYFGAELVQRMRTERGTRREIAYPLGIHDGSSDTHLLRTVVAFGADGSLSCSGEIPEGAWLQLMIGSRERALEAASRAAQQAIRPLNRVNVVLVFNSIARRRLLGLPHATMEIGRIREVVGTSTPLAGWYTYGEQGPFGTASVYERTAFQTGSILIVALGT